MILDIIKEYLDYDPDTGVFTWEKRPSRSQVKIGAVAGGINRRGYREIFFMSERYYAHRLAWWWVHGEMPIVEIDHKDTVKDHNWIKNLRPAGRSTNVANAGRRKRSGYKGVYFNAALGKWRVRIGVKYKQLHLGLFENEEDAARAYDVAAVKHFGEFANLNLPRERAS